LFLLPFYVNQTDDKMSFLVVFSSLPAPIDEDFHV